jgi:hypothetical protein
LSDEQHGVRFRLPEVPGGWRVEGNVRLAAGVRIQIETFPLAAVATPDLCRADTQRRLRRAPAPEAENGAEQPMEAVAEPGVGAPANVPVEKSETQEEQPTATWRVTIGQPGVAIRHRLAFYARGRDCVLVQVASPPRDALADLTFQTVAQSLRVLPLSPLLQRQTDLAAGMRFLERREPAAALDRFETLAEREPQLARAHLGALLAAYELGPTRYAEGLAHGFAVQAAERELSPEQRSLALRALGVMLLTQDQPKAAAAALAELVVREPQLAEGLYNYACALARAGDPVGALVYLGRAFQIDRQLVEHARADPDLASLREDPAFQRMLGPAATSRP